MKFQLDCRHLPFSLTPRVCQLFEEAVEHTPCVSFMDLVPIRFEAADGHFLQASVTCIGSSILLNEITFGRSVGGEHKVLFYAYDDPLPSDSGFKLLETELPEVITVGDAFMVAEKWLLAEVEKGEGIQYGIELSISGSILLLLATYSSSINSTAT